VAEAVVAAVEEETEAVEEETEAVVVIIEVEAIEEEIEAVAAAVNAEEKTTTAQNTARTAKPTRTIPLTVGPKAETPTITIITRTITTTRNKTKNPSSVKTARREITPRKIVEMVRREGRIRVIINKMGRIINLREDVPSVKAGIKIPNVLPQPRNSLMEHPLFAEPAVYRISTRNVPRNTGSPFLKVKMRMDLKRIVRLTDRS
jgi:hypothetical protein